MLTYTIHGHIIYNKSIHLGDKGPNMGPGSHTQGTKIQNSPQIETKCKTDLYKDFIQM